MKVNTADMSKCNKSVFKNGCDGASPVPLFQLNILTGVAHPTADRTLKQSDVGLRHTNGPNRQTN